MHNYHSNRIWIGLLTVGLVVPQTASAGTVELSGNGFLAGNVRRVDDAKRPYVVVEIDSELVVAVAGVHSRRVIDSSELADYRAQAADVGDDADAHYELSRWCRQNSWFQQAKFHLTRAIDLNPDHTRARAALGYIRHQGKWVEFDQLRRSQGLVKDRRGRWVLPQMLASQKQSDANNEASKRWIKTLAGLRKRASRGDGEAIASLKSIDDPLASMAIAAELSATRGKRNADRSLRRLYVDLLGKFRTDAAVSALIETGLVEPDAVIREEALRHLGQYGKSSAIASYLPLLKSNSPAQVRAAARALSAFPDPELAMQYTDALITIQKTRQQVGSGGTQAGFSNTGGGGMTQGAKIVERQTSIKHPEVLQILKAIAPDVDFGYEEQQWRAYFARQRNPSVGDLRRDG
ncbi:MAG: HEAT repeat domain-containing protein [Planctomycetota bacterium]